MQRTGVLVFDDGRHVRLGGMTLTERAVLLASGAGFEPVFVWGPREPDPNRLERLRARGAAPVRLAAGEPPFASIPGDAPLLVTGPGALFGPSLLDAITRGPEDETVMATDGGTPAVIFVPSRARAAVREDRSIDDLAASLTAQGAVRELRDTGVFLRRLTGHEDTGAVEREYIRHLTGGGESYFTKKIRRFSVPLTTRLVRLGARPSHVTFGGLALAAASAWCLSRGSYAAGVLGGLLYYASMVFDCSDGEVARVTLREGPAGAWLETFVDYLTYFLILGAIAIASQTRAAADAHRLAAWIALAGSVLVVLVLIYMRQRVAGADPGQFDDASSRVLAKSSKFHRFARWGRQWIKRSSIAHLVLFLAIVNQIPVLLYLWAFGATVAALVVLIVEPFVIRRVTVPPAASHLHGK